jgi:hypothetical protein
LIRRELAVALCAAGLALPCAASARTVSLPWPPEVLPQTPPLAPKVDGPLSIQPRFFRRASNRERVVVGLDEDGTPNSIRVHQTIVLKRLGDYVFAIPAPVKTVLPGPGTGSPPGQRTNQILWQGFSPGTRRLAAVADLRVGDSAPLLPVKVHLERSGLRNVVVIENVTGVTAKSYEADVEPAGLAQVVGRIRNAVRRGFTAEGLNVEVRGRQRPVDVRVATPVAVSGSVGGGAGERRFHGVLDGVHRVRLRVFVPGPRPAAISMRVRTLPVADRVRPTQSVEQQLANAIDLELSYARKRQYDQFLAAADPTGRSTTTYVYRTAPRPLSAAPIETSGSNGHTAGWVALGLLLALGLPAAAVVWARS